MQRATCDALPPQLPPDLPRPVDLEVRVVDAPDLDAQLVVAPRPRRPLRRDPACWARYRKYVDGAIGSTAQIGSTPYVAR